MEHHEINDSWWSVKQHIAGPHHPYGACVTSLYDSILRLKNGIKNAPFLSSIQAVTSLDAQGLFMEYSGRWVCSLIRDVHFHWAIAVIKTTRTACSIWIFLNSFQESICDICFIWSECWSSRECNVWTHLRAI